MKLSKADIKKLGTILGVWAHPDDETFSSACIMAAAIENGQTVACVTATRGEAGVRDESRWPAERLGDIRSQELAAALELLGVSNHHWLDYPDGCCCDIDEPSPVGRIVELIETYKPDTILTFGPDGMTGHDDHKTVSRWANLAVQEAGTKAKVYHAVQTTEQYDELLEADKHFNIFFNIDKPPLVDQVKCDIYFEPSKELLEKKLAALRSMPSQSEDLVKKFGDRFVEGKLGAEAFVRSV